jgi:tRNA (guanine26-N2/guanine27-N2)-dimethyltransferase
MKQKESNLEFEIGEAFYRPSSSLSRDLGVLAAKSQKAEQTYLRILDGMSACGVRTLRYLSQAGADFVWANDADREIHSVLSSNLDRFTPDCYRITHLPIQHVLAQAMIDRQYFNLIDLDAFGNPLPFISHCLQALKLGGLLYITSTDGRSLSGQLPEQSLRQWGSFVRSHPAVHEQVLRVLIGAIHQQAAILGYGIEPVFSLFSGQVHRVMLRLLPKANLQPQNYGFLGYCHTLGEFQIVDWRSLGRIDYQGYPVTVSGPMWLGELHSPVMLKKMLEQSESMDWITSTKILNLMLEETAMPPYFHTLGEVGRRGKMDIPRRDQLRDRLLAQGYQFGLTHIHPQGFKTNATLADCIAAVKTDPSD